MDGEQREKLQLVWLRRTLPWVFMLTIDLQQATTHPKAVLLRHSQKACHECSMHNTNPTLCNSFSKCLKGCLKVVHLGIIVSFITHGQKIYINWQY